MTDGVGGGITDEGEEWLTGGHVGGAVRVGDTVRRPVGPWTPAVHALLGHLAPRLPHVPKVLGFDERGWEVVSYLPGTVIDVTTERLTLAQIASVTEWTRAFHGAVADFAHPGPWRYFPLEGTTMIGHNDIAPFNVCFDGDTIAGVFDWDMAGRTTPLYELAFIAWTCVPLWEDIGADAAARRLTAIADGYGAFDAVGASERVRVMVEWAGGGRSGGSGGEVVRCAVRILPRAPPQSPARAARAASCSRGGARPRPRP